MQLLGSIPQPRAIAAELASARTGISALDAARNQTLVRCVSSRQGWRICVGRHRSRSAVLNQSGLGCRYAALNDTLAPLLSEGSAEFETMATGVDDLESRAVLDSLRREVCDACSEQLAARRRPRRPLGCTGNCEKSREKR